MYAIVCKEKKPTNSDTGSENKKRCQMLRVEPQPLDHQVLLT